MSPEPGQSSTSGKVPATISSSPTAVIPSTGSRTSAATGSTEAVSQDGLVLAGTVPAFTPVVATPTATLPSTTTSNAPTNSAAGQALNSPLSQPAIISISVVSGVVAFAVIALIFFAVRHRKKAKEDSTLLRGPPTCSNRSTITSFTYPSSELGYLGSGSASRAHSIPSPLPIFNSPFHDEKEVFAPSYNNLAPASPRRPTYPIISPLKPSVPLRKSRSWNFDTASNPHGALPQSPALLSPGSPATPLGSLPPISPISARSQSAANRFNDIPPSPLGRTQLPSAWPSSVALAEQTRSRPGSGLGVGLEPVELPERTSRMTPVERIKRSETTRSAKSVASSVYSQASRTGGREGAVPGRGPSRMMDRERRESLETLSIQSILDLMDSTR